ncbi:winged helix-turn-helix domain-containing protein [Pseudoalteromonas luteoviolacea]|uniref:OmpR/PhoB-type domain-containing protein n=1 Tax=Pseudoalteromonas luteoviolacea S4054 TaxID=1129367 RepID=A0A0F6AH44_9GAMM|nr:winged helix-turn-helix domain-containing protein [Pseudoalteromonas luteoviolacea]AOT08182.1 hypothetical protein S4054249_10150 [Pseudoalteromonas luteoviolacea]AOT13099.1 hypothetical protein S40542_10150 [Pseudoalteromonas luteoviolacea]AOT18011.1 hypothetical protein S4054_10145 [Pseudoalteromonas luteoviolacea]KKE84714.1 hypothetical protein N479_07920 [Pseudoalteromonas luteoviolacea S4054]KZN74405.1 hypothetical protein N481_00730 [Pseudoalteromonas luteoviolacea S4047-1]
MRWKIGEITFCDQTLTLTFGGRKTQLEPMVSEVLRFFCLHPHTMVSRDELIEQVWEGRIVTDNAVNRVITKLRKALHDDPRKPAFIVTFPKKGYQLIADVSVIVESQPIETRDSDKSLNTHKFNRVTFLAMGILAVLLLSFLYLVLQSPLKSNQERLTDVSALTREPGLELNPHLSPDGQYLLFTEVHNGSISLKLKTLNNEEVDVIDHGVDTWEGPASWRKDGKAFVYLTTKANSCQYFLRSFDDGEIGEPKLIHNCRTGSYGKISFTHNDDLLIFNEAAYPGGPFYLFSLQLSTGVKTRLAQPLTGLGGYSQFDLHPTKNKLLISAIDSQFSTGLYVIDIENHTFEHLFNNEGGAVWGHSGEQLVLLGGYPGNEIVSYDLAGNDRTTLYSNSHALFGLSRHPNGKGYLFSTGSRDRNITYYSMTSKSQRTLAATSVDERLARFSYDSQSVAYVSLATGREQVWLYDFTTQRRAVLTQFNMQQHIVDLKWTDSGRFIFVLTHNKVFQVSVNSGHIKQLKIPQTEIVGLSIKDDSTIAFSLKDSDKWRVHYYDTRSDTLISEDPNWQFVSFSKSTDDIIWQDIHGEYFTGVDHTPVRSEKIKTIPLVVQSRFNLQKQASQWLWQQVKSRRYQLYQYDELKNIQKLLITSDSSDFDWHNDKLLYNSVHYANSDIYTASPAEF